MSGWLASVWRDGDEYQYQYTNMPQGKVKWFSLDKGYGFIEPDDGSKDVFVHRNNVENLDRNEGLREGEEVEYEVEETPKGLSAQNVRRVSTTQW